MASVSNDDGSQVSLNIMPMLDIFSILILFLLMNFSTDPVSHELNQAMELPESNTVRSLDEIPAVVVSKNDIQVNGKIVSTLVNKKITDRDITQGAIFPLFKELEKLSEANKKLKKKEKDKPGKLTLEIDKDHKFSLVKKVLFTAQEADFVSFKLMVSKLNGG